MNGKNLFDIFSQMFPSLLTEKTRHFQIPGEKTLNLRNLTISKGSNDLFVFTYHNDKLWKLETYKYNKI